jgi:polyisoprenoid-binding protein YceI
MKKLILSIFLTTNVFADVKGKVEWQAIGNPSFLKINGEGMTFTCKLEGDQTVKGICEADLTQIKTGKDLRDEHLHNKYLDTKNFPKATLTLDMFHVKQGKSEFKGLLKIKTDEKPIKGTIELNADKKGTAEFELDISNYPSIGNPEYLGITLAKKVNVKVTFQ